MCHVKNLFRDPEKREFMKKCHFRGGPKGRIWPCGIQYKVEMGKKMGKKKLREMITSTFWVTFLDFSGVSEIPDFGGPRGQIFNFWGQISGSFGSEK